MRPQKRIDKKQKIKALKKSKVHQKTHKKPCYIHNVELSDFDSINQIIRDHKYQLKGDKKTWKVVPKDSCEVYKERRKRQEEELSEKDTEEQGAGRDANNKQRSHVKRKVRRPLKRDSRGRFLPESKTISECSCCTRSNTDTDTTYTQSEAAYDQ